MWNMYSFTHKQIIKTTIILGKDERIDLTDWLNTYISKTPKCKVKLILHP